ncbi:MAG: ribonuclease III [Clostridia bacterium]|nr:ribonuclease III [Clostridia bacterium]
MADMPYSPEGLQKALGYTYNDISLLQNALTHSSYSNEIKLRHGEAECNERLEFLGDSVLSIVVSEYLFSHYTKRPEGELTRMRAEVVCEKALSKFAKKIDLGSYLMLGHGEEKNNGRERKSILADAFEAVLASIYLDAGKDGKKMVARFLLPLIITELEEAESDGHGKDYKTLLQQIVQQAEGEVLEYVTVAESGPDHIKSFTVEARLNSNVIGRGKGASKREAEQNAASEALKLFGE